MPVLNHTIIQARDREQSARFLSSMLGLPEPTRLGHFDIVQVGETSLDFLETTDEIRSQHYAFLVTEAEFDQVFARIQAAGLPFWADPARRAEGEINTWDGGRGVYWEDPNGHLLEIITRPYGSGGSTTTNPHPLIAEDA